MKKRKSEKPAKKEPKRSEPISKRLASKVDIHDAGNR